MKSVRIRSDFTVKLPEELRGRIRPGETLGVVVSGGRVTYVRTGEPSGPSLREIIERVRRTPPAKPLSEGRIEEMVHRTRRRRQ